MAKTLRSVLIWGVVLAAVIVPLFIAAQSPLLAWRDPIYVVAGFAGIVGLALLFVQPLLAQGVLPAVPFLLSRMAHRWGGALLLLAVVVHIGGLWITSPPDVVDVLLLRSPTPFSLWAFIAMWGVFAAALIAALRRKLRLGPRVWRRIHLTLAGMTVISSVVHAILIEGTMGQISKALLCAMVLAALGKTYWDMARLRQNKIKQLRP